MIVMKRISSPKKILLGASSFLFVFIAGAQKAHAFAVPVAVKVGLWIGSILLGFTAAKDMATKLIEFIANLISSVILFVGEIFLRIAASLIEIAINLNAQVAESSIIKTGYDITLSVANIAIVVAIVVIAFMVMLRRSNAGPLLFRFIAVALLINFGYYIVINFLIAPVDSITSQVVAAINVHPEGGYYSTFGQSLLGESIDPDPVIKGALQEDPTTAEQLAEGDLITVLAMGLAKVLFIGVVEFVLVITMFAYAFMLIVRYVALSFLIILFPLALIFWMFPKVAIVGGNAWGQWTKAFTRWLLFAPIGLFFIWLAIKLITDSNVLQVAEGETETFLATTGNMFVVVGFLLGGLIVANKMSITGAKWADGQIKKVSGKIKGWATAKGKLYGWRAASAPTRSELGKKATGWMQNRRGLKFAGRALNTLGAKGEQAVTRGAQTDLKTLSQNTDRLKQALPSLNGARLAEALHILRQKNALDTETLDKVLKRKGDDVKKTLVSLGRAGDYEDIERGGNTSVQVLAAKEEYEKSAKTQGDYDKLKGVMEAFSQRVYTSLKDVDKMSTKAFANSDPNSTAYKAAQAQLGEMLDRMPEAVATLSRKSKANEYKTIQGIFDKYVKNFEENKIGLPPNMRGTQEETRNKLKWIEENMPAELEHARRLYAAHGRSMAGTMLGPAGAAPAAPPATP